MAMDGNQERGDNKGEFYNKSWLRSTDFKRELKLKLQMQMGVNEPEQETVKSRSRTPVSRNKRQPQPKKKNQKHRNDESEKKSSTKESFKEDNRGRIKSDDQERLDNSRINFSTLNIPKTNQEGLPSLGLAPTINNF